MKDQSLTPITLGPVEFYNVESFVSGGVEYVRFYISSSVVVPDGWVENDNKPVVMDRRSWDAMTSALTPTPPANGCRG